jgi:DNA-binding Xre family transcriptional regulator
MGCHLLSVIFINYIELIVTVYRYRVNSNELNSTPEICYTDINSFWLGGGVMTIGNAVKERIIELCKERNITINKLGTLSGVTQSTINNIISGRNNSTTISTIKKLCDGLNITVIDFFDCEAFSALDQEVK